MCIAYLHVRLIALLMTDRNRIWMCLPIIRFSRPPLETSSFFSSVFFSLCAKRFKTIRVKYLHRIFIRFRCFFFHLFFSLSDSLLHLIIVSRWENNICGTEKGNCYFVFCAPFGHSLSNLFHIFIHPLFCRIIKREWFCHCFQSFLLFLVFVCVTLHSMYVYICFVIFLLFVEWLFLIVYTQFYCLKAKNLFVALCVSLFTILVIMCVWMAVKIQVFVCTNNVEML